MYELIKNFPAQLGQALALHQSIKLQHSYTNKSNLVICGLGGSGIAGDLVSDLTSAELKVPVTVVKCYDLPALVNENTLLILNSYSGNTEEIIKCAQQAKERNLKPLCIAAGGKLKEFASAEGYDFIQLPSGFPPRTTLGYGAVLLLGFLSNQKYLNLDIEKVSKEVADFLTTHQESIESQAKIIAKQLKNKVTILYADSRIGSVALRMKQQITENSKSPCWHNLLPELNHNELVGWKFKQPSLACIFIRSDFENPRNAFRFEYMTPLLQESAATLIEMKAHGKNLFEQYFYLVNLGDYISYFLGLEHEQDPTEVKVLDKLKIFMNEKAF